MIRLVALVFALLISFTISLPTCNLSYWVNSKDRSCSASPNGTYSALTYNGNCTSSPDKSRKTSYKLIINSEIKTVQNFTLYNGETCAKGSEILIGETPLSLNSCGLLYFMTTSTTYVQVGTLIFNCEG